MKVYLDNSGTTKAYDEVGDLVRKVLCEDFGNPSSMHYRGVESEQYIKEAKDTLAKILKVQQKEIFFTSGGTESDNWALIGAARKSTAGVAVPWKIFSATVLRSMDMEMA